MDNLSEIFNFIPQIVKNGHKVEIIYNEKDNVYDIVINHKKFIRDSPIAIATIYENDKFTKDLAIETLKAYAEEILPWKPKKGDKYYFITSYGSIDCKVWTYSEENYRHYNCYNIFRSDVEASIAIDSIEKTLIDCHKEFNKPIILE